MLFDSNSYPILEYDPAREALIEPSKVIRPRDVPEHCVICFFQEVIDKVVAEHGATLLARNKWEDGPHPLYEITYQGRRLAFFQPGIGGPLAAGLLEEMIAWGCKKFIACGGCGVLEKEIAVGHLILVTSAVRDEGVSYHYLPPAREVRADESVVQALAQTMDRLGVSYRRGKTWTTDAPYRETAGKVLLRRQEGCVTVEMEAASFLAVAEFRGVPFGQVLYGGDDLSGVEWDHRSWQSRSEVRENLFWLCAEACLAL
jgi:uridine phosphorylase